MGANPLVKKKQWHAQSLIHVTYVLSFTAHKFELSICVVKKQGRATIFATRISDRSNKQIKDQASKCATVLNP